MSRIRRHVGIPPFVDLDDRPRPVKDAGTLVFKLYGVIGSIVLALVGVGVLTAVQGAAIEDLWGAVVGVVNAVATLLTAFGIRRSAEPKVTPISDPRDNKLRPLVAVEAGSRLVSKDQAPGNLLGVRADVAAAAVAARRPGSVRNLGTERYVEDAPARRRDNDTDDDTTTTATTTAASSAIYAATTPVADTPAPAPGCVPPSDSGGGSGGFSSGDGGGSSPCGGDGGGGV